jgi:hypothetical protein
MSSKLQEVTSQMHNSIDPNNDDFATTTTTPTTTPALAWTWTLTTSLATPGDLTTPAFMTTTTTTDATTTPIVGMLGTIASLVAALTP